MKRKIYKTEATYKKGNLEECQVDLKTENNVTLTFHSIRYEVRKKLNDIPCGKTEMKEILHGVSGMLPPGLNAIMGPTGSGKTSLIDILSQRKDPKGLTGGLVLLNGEKPPNDFRLMSGYVVQDDIVMGTLSVRENLAFSANLRLPKKLYNAQAKKKKVDLVISQLGLQACADTKVGTEFVRGVSGGERKRVNIGMEMILDPPILFLDEPTTGLDANTANSIILLLYKLAKEGRNITISIHQPRYSIFSLFDRLIILHKGFMVYRGLANKAVDYFSDAGYRCPKFHNPADFFLDIVGGDVNTAELIGRMNMSGGDQAVEATDTQDRITVALKDDEVVDNTEHLLETFAASSSVLEESKELESIRSCYENESSDMDGTVTPLVPETHYANGFWTQLGAVLRRTSLNVIRNPLTSVVQSLIMIQFGVLIGLIYYQSDTSFKSGIQNRVGCFFFLITTQVMANMSALEIFIKNRPHFVHEAASGYYRVSVYFIAQLIADIIPNRVVPNLIFSAIIYYMNGFQPVVGKFFIFFFVLVLVTISASSLAFFVSASVKIFAIANVVVALPYILMMLFSGFLVNTGSLLTWLEWIKYVSIFRFGMNALSVNELSGLVFIDDPSYPGFNRSSATPCLTNNFTLIPNCATGEMYMDKQDIEYGVWGLWQNIVALFGISIAFLGLAYIQMRRMNKFK